MTPLEKVNSMKMPFAELKGVTFTEAEKDRAAATAQHPPAQVFNSCAGHASEGLTLELLPAKQPPQSPKQLEITGWLDGNESVSSLARGGRHHVDHNQRAIAASLRHEQARAVCGISFQMSRMRFNRVAAPEDHQIAAVLDLTQRTG